MKQLLSLLLALMLLFTLAACSAKAPTPEPEPAPEPEQMPGVAPKSPPLDREDEGLVGVSMPAENEARWARDGAAIEQALTEFGYPVDLQFAANTAEIQITQLEQMISDGVKVLVICPVDAYALDTVLAKAKQAGIAVISYERLICGSDAVTAYVTFDNMLVGVLQGQYIVDALDLPNAGDQRFNIEFIGGDPADMDSSRYYNGAISVLQPYIDSGILICPSNATEFQQIATEHASTDLAQARFESILTKSYTDKPLDAVLASDDSTAMGVAKALAAAYTGDVYPILTGQDCDMEAVKNILRGKQAMSVFRDTRDLAAKAAELCRSILEGGAPEINDTTTYDNGVFIVPTYLCPPKVCTAENYRELLIDSGCYTAEQLGEAALSPSGELNKG